MTRGNVVIALHGLRAPSGFKVVSLRGVYDIRDVHLYTYIYICQYKKTGSTRNPDNVNCFTCNAVMRIETCTSNAPRYRTETIKFCNDYIT